MSGGVDDSAITRSATYMHAHLSRHQREEHARAYPPAPDIEKEILLSTQRPGIKFPFICSIMRRTISINPGMHQYKYYIPIVKKYKNIKKTLFLKLLTPNYVIGFVYLICVIQQIQSINIPNMRK